MERSLEELKSANFKEILEKSYTFPVSYTFKVIVKENQLQDLNNLSQSFTIQTRPSAKGNYIALSLTKLVESADEVVKAYEMFSKIPGVIML